MTNRIDVLHSSVAEFIKVYDGPHDPDVWMTLVQEEAKEVRQAAADLLKEIIDLAYVIQGHNLSNGGIPDLDENVITAIKWGQMLEDVLGNDVMVDAVRRVHASNMSKLGVDGKPIRREDGKVLKGPNYEPADLSDLVHEIV
jgi:predicted HAD superfamily Cof-like phosphohydrolase